MISTKMLLPRLMLSLSLSFTRKRGMQRKKVSNAQKEVTKRNSLSQSLVAVIVETGTSNDSIARYNSINLMALNDSGNSGGNKK